MDTYLDELGFLSISSEKVKAIVEFQTLNDMKSLQRTLEMFNCVPKFIPNYANLSTLRTVKE